jgi:glycosyltransferase involved in cell wall biosynthesis
MILIISSVFPPEPIVSASIAFDLASKLSEKYEIKVLTPRPSRPFGFYFKETPNKCNYTFEQIILNSFTFPQSRILGRMRESYSFGRHAIRYIKKNNERIRCIYLNTFPLLAQYLIVKASKKYGIPAVIHIQDIYPESLTNKLPFFKKLIWKILLPIDKFSLKNATRIVVISEIMSDVYTKTRGIEKEKMDIIFNWQNEEEFINYKNSEANNYNKLQNNKPFTFMYLGNIGPVAKVEFVIQSFHRAKLQTSVLIIAGSGSKKEDCINLANSLENHHISFMEVPLGKVPEIQNTADVMVLPLIKGAALSSIPSKLPAYMFSAKPIIACVDENSDTARVIKTANCGWIVAPENIDALADTMTYVSQLSHKHLQQLGNNGFNYALQFFSRNNNLARLTNIIEETTLKQKKYNHPNKTINHVRQ